MCDQLVEASLGWLFVMSGNLFNREPSQDQHCHACLGHGGHHRYILRFHSAVAATPLSTQHWISGRATLRLFILRKQCLDHL